MSKGGELAMFESLKSGKLLGVNRECGLSGEFLCLLSIKSEKEIINFSVGYHTFIFICFLVGVGQDNTTIFYIICYVAGNPLADRPQAKIRFIIECSLQAINARFQ